MKLSVVLATRNEEENIARCLASVVDIADEIIVVDEFSTDKTVEICKKFGAKVYLEQHHDIFHVTKQIALEKAKGDWILQMDADEVVSKELQSEITKVVNGEEHHISPSKAKLFERHSKIVSERDGKIGKDSKNVVGYFVPRMNMFLDKPLIHAGVYPDGVIRLVKNGKARFPQKSVHEQIELDGAVSWLNNDLLHYDSPSLKRYFSRLNRYTDLQASEIKRQKLPKNIFSFLKYVFYKPIFTFVNLYIRHRGFLDGVNGFLWSFLSSLHFPIAYFKYLTNNEV